MFEFDAQVQLHADGSESDSSPDAVVLAHLSRVPHPTPGSVAVAAGVIYRSYHGWEGKRDALGVCLDLAEDVIDSTTVLAEMFHDHHAAIPRKWVEDPEIERAVLINSGYLEIAVLQADRVFGSNDSGVRERIEELTRFVAELQTS